MIKHETPIFDQRNGLCLVIVGRIRQKHILYGNRVEAEEVESIPDDKPVYIQEPAKGGEAIWWFELHEGWRLIETSTVGDFFKEYCGDEDMIAYSIEL